MAHGSPSFIDVVALEAVRTRFARGDALAALSSDFSRVLWANGPGAALLGFADVETALGSPAPFNAVARRQLMAASGFPRHVQDRPAMVRLIEGVQSRTVLFLASTLALPDGDAAVLLAVPASDAEAGSAERAIAGIAQPGQFVALIGAGGEVVAASPGFEELGLVRDRLAALAGQIEGDRARPLKRMIESRSRALPAGLVRLTDEISLLIVVDEGLPAPGEPAEPLHALDAAEARSEPGEQAALEPAAAGKADEPEPLAPEEGRFARWRGQPALRFTWRMDGEARFREVSPEFTDLLGLDPRAILGRTFADVSGEFGFDEDGEIGALFAARHTWSGKSVVWPTSDRALGVPVDLAALPTFSRARVFEGFRGFGIARLGDAVILEPASPSEPARPEPLSPTADEAAEQARNDPSGMPDTAQLGVGNTGADAPPAGPPALDSSEATSKGLTPTERHAFREIGERLRVEGGLEIDRQAPAGSDRLVEPAASTGLSETIAAAQAELPAPEDVLAEAVRDTAPPDAGPEPDVAEAEPDESPAMHASEADMARLSEQAAAEIGSAPSAADSEAPAGQVAADAEGCQGAARQAGADEREAEPDRSAGAPSVDAPVSLEDAPASPPVGEPPRSARPWASDGTFFLPRTREGRRTAEQPEIAPPAPADTSILDRLPIPVLIHSGDVLHYANDEFLSLTSFADLATLEGAGGLGALLSAPGSEAGAAAQDQRMRLRTADAREFPVDAFLRTVPWQGGKALLLVVRRLEPDPEQAALRADLERRLDEMRTIVDTATDGVVLMSTDGAIRSISRPAEALFGIDPGQAAGRPFGMLFALESQRVVADYLNGLSDNGVASVLNDGREVIGREMKGGFIPLFMTIGKLPENSGFCAVLRDITPWKRAEEELTQSRAKAERASSHKTDFLARVSHEIRTPLNAIIGFSELMLDEKFGAVANERYRDYLRDINRSGNHVLDLVNDLLDISKIEAGEQEMSYEAVALNDALTETIATMQPQANRERVIIRSSLAARLPDVVADLRSIRQIALNLLSNAVRYTPAGGQVIVSTSFEPSGDVALRVRDTGVGMSAGEIEQALKPFKQINALKRARGDGTGLGLPLTKAMVEANRARFVISSSPGEGTLVEIIFPATRVLAE